MEPPRCNRLEYKDTELSRHIQAERKDKEKRPDTTDCQAFGQLVALGFAVAGFTPVPYQRPRLGRPS